MSHYHGNKISGSQQRGALATTTAISMGKKNRVYISETTNLHVHHAFLCIS